MAKEFPRQEVPPERLPEVQAPLRACDHLLRGLDAATAVALSHFRKLGADVVRAVRRDDVHFYDSLRQEGAEFLSPAKAKDFWRIVRRSLPRFRDRKREVPPLLRFDLADQWDPYFMELEAGHVVDPDDLLALNANFEDAAFSAEPPGSLQITLKDLPALPQLEQSFRATQAERATGFDRLPSGLYKHHAPDLAHCFFPLALKLFLWSQEPLQSKGGAMSVIPKRLGPVERQHYRGIMLLPTFGKRTHAIIRQKLMDEITPRRCESQIGGFAGQSVLFGVQGLRAVATLQDSFGLSAAFLFLDIRNAFHQLVREQVVGVGRREDFDHVLRSLGEASDPHPLKDLCSNGPLLQQLGVSPLLTKLLANVHSSTRRSIQGRSVIRTSKGTRPGSPLADIVFLVLMHDVTSRIIEWFRAQPDQMRLLDMLQTDVVTVVWADLALPLLAQDCTTSPPRPGLFSDQAVRGPGSSGQYDARQNQRSFGL